MKKRILIVIEDDSEHLKIIKEMFSKSDLNDEEIDLFRKSVSIYPQSENEFNELISNVNFLHSPLERISEAAVTFFKTLITKLNPLGLILDYELSTSVKDINAIDLYRKMDISIPTIIYTSYAGDRFDAIKDEIEQLFGNKKIILIQKRDPREISVQKTKSFLLKVKNHFDPKILNLLEGPKYDDL